MARAQNPDVWDETTCREVPVEKLGPDLANQRIWVDAKIIAINGADFVVRGSDQVTLHLDDKLVSLGRPNEFHEYDNVRAFGYIPVVRGRPQTFFLVEALNRRPDDPDLFRERIVKLTKGGDAAGLRRLGAEIDAEGNDLKRRPTYHPIALEAFRAALELREKSIREDDAAGWLSLAQDYLDTLGDKKAALKRTLRALHPGEDVSREAKKMLDALNAVLYGGEYILYDEMLEREGFIQRNGQWIRRERAAFEDAIAREPAVRVRRAQLTDEAYEDFARKHYVEIGMTKQEVAQAIGYPDDIDRIRRGQDIFDMWTYTGRGAYYFKNGILFARPDQPR